MAPENEVGTFSRSADSVETARCAVRLRAWFFFRAQAFSPEVKFFPDRRAEDGTARRGHRSATSLPKRHCAAAPKWRRRDFDAFQRIDAPRIFLHPFQPARRRPGTKSGVTPANQGTISGMSDDIQIVPLSRAAGDVSRFLEISYGIYRDDPHWVAPLLSDLKKVFTDANPLFGHADMQLWTARRNGRDIGRMAGILDRNYTAAAK